MSQKIVLASNNQGKLKEFHQLLAPLGFSVHSQSEFNVPDSPEPYFTFLENALSKARHAAKLTGLPALADDSGICVPSLGGAPGVFSARYAGEPKSDENNNQKLVMQLQGMDDRSAYYYCVLVFVRSENDPQPVIADGRWNGVFVDSPAGDGGFGYDPHFYVPEFGKTAAQLTPLEKNGISHRAKALQDLIQKLTQQA
ncbi:RdgB/HAM1 family non-canonical purine NTP pyrophosphatase [Undibacterium sp. LX40W]|uniref:dITP/XTP pyrophosphatase n=1 Tax=Undibacterium nitidum TaxID=2762298 RepID=A0A923KSA7_9BURK|nr:MULTISPECIES: RdgB/HAM1 family non-canonical purine NTP pyrophosphatase [Undibacterium]MBC3880274.1 RdgB/HAM1 family non-canonical purine NTP pyrophosphatase [Undibacterium nitidum]MBC3890990.1 RdgB/HAM1 family non-canonical purine NTP pyrophosphatase [Undibacterium sp. LX40W]